jgi:hypothetical protein
MRDFVRTQKQKTLQDEDELPIIIIIILLTKDGAKKDTYLDSTLYCQFFRRRRMPN